MCTAMNGAKGMGLARCDNSVIPFCVMLDHSACSSTTRTWRRKRCTERPVSKRLANTKRSTYKRSPRWDFSKLVHFSDFSGTSAFKQTFHLAYEHSRGRSLCILRLPRESGKTRSTFRLSRCRYSRHQLADLHPDTTY